MPSSDLNIVIRISRSVMPSLSLYVRYMDTQELKHDIREILVDDAAEYDALLWKKKKDEEKSRTA